jgi:hypothetical protein
MAVALTITSMLMVRFAATKSKWPKQSAAHRKSGGDLRGKPMEKFRYYVVYWSRDIAGDGAWAPSAQIIDRDAPIETAEDIDALRNHLQMQQQQITIPTDWKRIQ